MWEIFEFALEEGDEHVGLTGLGAESTRNARKVDVMRVVVVEDEEHMQRHCFVSLPVDE